MFLLTVITINAQCGEITINGNTNSLDCDVSGVDLSDFPLVKFTIQLKNGNSPIYLYPRLDETARVVPDFKRLFKCKTFVKIWIGSDLEGDYMEVTYRIEEDNISDNFKGSFYVHELDANVSFNFNKNNIHGMQQLQKNF